MSTGGDADPTLVRERHLGRAARLKRRTTIASILGFAALFGLAAQHVVRGVPSSVQQATSSKHRQVTSRARTTYFDQQDSGFAFGALPQQSQAPGPMAQTSVS